MGDSRHGWHSREGIHSLRDRGHNFLESSAEEAPLVGVVGRVGAEAGEFMASSAAAGGEVVGYSGEEGGRLVHCLSVAWG